MAYSFKAKGHENILATHARTLEFTSDPDLSPDGDCIVGVSADFSPQQLKVLVDNHNRLCMRIKAGGLAEEVTFTVNKGFNSKREIVLRFSEFSSDRTLGFRASKSAAHLDRKLVKLLRNPGQEIVIEIEPLVKAWIFDLDNTLAELKTRIEYAHNRVAEKLFKEYGVYGPTTMKLMRDIDMDFSIRGVGSSPSTYDRHLWFRQLFKDLGLQVQEDKIQECVDLYWKSVHERVRMMPDAEQVLRELKKQYKIAVMTDSDGDRELKVERVRKIGLMRYVDVFMTSDDIGQNKPNRAFYERVLKKLGVSAEECIMIGDKPEVDLKLAKELGMTTVWIRYGKWTEHIGNRHFDYVDHEIKDLRQLLSIMNEL